MKSRVIHLCELLCSGVEDIVRQRPDVIHWQRLADGITPLQLASVRNRVFIVRHFALNVSLLLPIGTVEYAGITLGILSFAKQFPTSVLCCSEM